MNIYFVRHSKTVYTEDDNLRPLTEDGLGLLIHLEDYFKDIKIDSFYSSTFKRSIDTIKGVALEKELDIELIDDLRERKVSDIKIEDFISYAKNQWSDHDFKLPSGESLNETKSRGVKELLKIVESNDNDNNIIIGTHGTILSLIINHYDISFGYDGWSNLSMPDIILMKFDNNNFIGYEKINYIKEK
ncbi:histidine phosphatase family protein [Mycoplasmatota bacterium WC44]